MSKQTRGAGDLLVRIGAVLFIVGAVGTLATMAPLLLGTSRLPTPAYFVSMLMGVGLAVALVGLLKAAMAQRQPSAASSAASSSSRSSRSSADASGDASGDSDRASQAAAEL
ncbi:hypothetical protein [Actinacidiphila acididurans]|uniref:hypothetical protein n=1 Tax=Actinacidiphila acididurans TaxID=2784346 RepID=UPI0027DCE24F|nr:hypothetical protein [Actinacidiphila acididurans]